MDNSPQRTSSVNPHRHRLTEQQRLEVVATYLDGESTHSLARRFGVQRNAVVYLLDRASVKRRTVTDACRKYSLDESVFDDAENNPEAAYFVGLLMADGCVSDPKGYSPRIVLALNPRDAAHVESFRHFLKTDHPLVCRDADSKFDPSVSLTVSSRRLADSLARYGVVPRKTHIARVAVLENNRWFWSGVVDGDGSIMLGRRGMPSINLVGSKFLCDQFVSYVSVTAPGCKSKVNQHKSIWSFCTCGSPAVAVIRNLYAGNPYSLPRKKELAEQAMLWESSRVRRDWTWLTKEELLSLRSRLGSWRAVARELKMDRAALGRFRRHRGLS